MKRKKKKGIYIYLGFLEVDPLGKRKEKKKTSNTKISPKSQQEQQLISPNNILRKISSSESFFYSLFLKEKTPNSYQLK